MDKFTRWIFVFLAVLMLVYACGQYWTVQKELQNAQNCLVELRETAQRLTEENKTLRKAVAAEHTVQQPDVGEDTPGKE